MPHGLLIWIVLAIALQHGLPAACDAAAAGEGKFRRIPVAVHEGVHVGAVPGSLLVKQYGSDCRRWGFLRRGGLAGIEARGQENQENKEQEKRWQNGR